MQSGQFKVMKLRVYLDQECLQKENEKNNGVYFSEIDVFLVLQRLAFCRSASCVTTFVVRRQFTQERRLSRSMHVKKLLEIVFYTQQTDLRHSADLSSDRAH